MSIEHSVRAPPGTRTEKPGIEVPASILTATKQTVSHPLDVEGLAPENLNSVPNPFAVHMPNAVSAGSMDWGSSPSPPLTSSTPPPASSAPGGNEVTLASSGMRVPTTPGGSKQASAPAPAASKAKKSSPQKKEGPPNNRRQKRLERNRESARLSRRRRKQYLEVLEDRVNQLSLEMDKGRRAHVAVALPSILEQREQALQNQDLAALETILSRSSDELRVAATFQSQQVQSLVFPPHAKFLLWLSLQTDTYFRGGRAPSERLSAARIGERVCCSCCSNAWNTSYIGFLTCACLLCNQQMLSSGNDRVGPAHGMWPLLCNEVGLSYDQEERIRCAQRVLVQTPETWLDRHTGTASGIAMQSAHDCMQAVSNSIDDRERSIMSVLSEEQRLKFLHWSASNKQRLEGLKRRSVEEQDGFTVSPNNHQAANLYIINNRLQKALNKLATPPALVVGSSVKRLARRPSFESLGGSSGNLKDEGRSLSREGSFASSGSLKRSASELDLDGDKPPGQSVSPEAAEAAAQPTINAALGFVKGIMPLPPQPQPETVSSFVMPEPKPTPSLGQSVASQHPYHHIQSQQTEAPQPAVSQNAVVPQPVLSAPVTFQAPVPAQQQPVSSFLPQPLNAVPEEDGYLAQQGSDPADDFLFELAEEDWAIGEGFEMDTVP